MNLAIYTKETVILFYAGLLAVDVLYLVFRGTVKPASFLHPFKTAKELPLEFIMFQSMAVFAFIYLLFGLGIESNQYVSAHISDEAWKKYYLEIFVCFSALTALVSSQKATPLLLGLLGGSLVLLFSWSGNSVFTMKTLHLTMPLYPGFSAFSSSFTQLKKICADIVRFRLFGNIRHSEHFTLPETKRRHLP